MNDVSQDSHHGCQHRFHPIGFGPMLDGSVTAMLTHSDQPMPHADHPDGVDFGRRISHDFLVSGLG